MSTENDAPPWAKETAHIVHPACWERDDQRWIGLGGECDEERWRVSDWRTADWLTVSLEAGDLYIMWTVSDAQDVARAMMLMRRSLEMFYPPPTEP